MLGGGILALLFLAAVWAIVLLFAMPPWIAILATVAVLFGAVAFLFWGRLRARAASREIERSLGQQADAHAQAVRPDQQIEIEAMRAEFQKAVRSLKTSKLARGGADALAVLPWYMIIGPPGAGKSTALRASGLKFPFLSSRGGGVKGVGGTRNCEWWLTNDAVILDTAGRYATEEDDRDEWVGFLDVLLRTRPRKPINGLIVAVSVADVGGETEDGVIELAKRLRDRVDEVMARLRMVLPTYLLFTKSDLIPGFVESFGDLRKNERGQIWGFTLPRPGTADERGDAFQERFDELLACLEERTLQRIGEERQLAARERIHGFPQQFEALRSNLAAFVEHLFADNVYQDTPVLRGVYFTSGTQEGRTIDRVMTAMAEAFGIQPAVAAIEPVIEARSYFLRDVFAKVIFPDKSLAVRNAKAERRLVLARSAMAGAFGVVALLALLFPLRSFVLNKAFLGSTAEIVEGIAPQLHNADKGPPSVARLEPLRVRLDELVRYAGDGPPWSMRFGMYQGDDLVPHVRRLFASSVRRLVLDPVFRQDVSDMEAFARRLEGSDVVPALSEYARFYDKLKLHLLLTAPRGVGEPRIGPAQEAWIGAQIADRWSARGSSGADPVPAEVIGADAELFAKLLADDAGLALPRYEDVVRRVRRVMQRVPLSSLALARLVGEVDGKGYDITLSSLLGGPVPVLRSTAKVPGAFTRRGYESVVKARFDNPSAILEPWVVDIVAREGSAGEAEEMERLRSRYFLEYIDMWRRFLSSISVQGTVGNAQALAMLQDLTAGEPPPLRRLFQGTGYNTRLGGMAGALGKAAEGMLDKVRKKVAPNADPPSSRTGGGPADVERAFAGFVDFGVAPDLPVALTGVGGAPAPRNAALDVYQEQISFVRDALQTAMESSDPGPLLGKVQAARTRVRSLIDAQEIGWRPRLEALLWPPLEGASLSSVREAAAGASVKWCSTVALPFQRNIASRYPFRIDGDPAAIADVAEFFRPNSGILWGFYNEALRADVQRSGEGFQFARSLGGVSGFRPELLTFLKRAQEISTVLFPGGSADPSVQLSLRIRPTPRVAVVWFEVDGQKFDYRNGPEEWHRVVWPMQGKTSGASLRVRTASGQEEVIQQDGEWGLLRLIEAGRLAGEPGARDFAVSWSLPSLGTSVTVDFRPARSETPFFGVRHPGEKARLFSPFRNGIAAPLTIGKSGPACGARL
jgi:type VI secretion system protein ImpL